MNDCSVGCWFCQFRGTATCTMCGIGQVQFGLAAGPRSSFAAGYATATTDAIVHDARTLPTLSMRVSCSTNASRHRIRSCWSRTGSMPCRAPTSMGTQNVHECAECARGAASSCVVCHHDQCSSAWPGHDPTLLITRRLGAGGTRVQQRRSHSRMGNANGAMADVVGSGGHQA